MSRNGGRPLGNEFSKTASGIEISRAEQGTPYVNVQLEFPGQMVPVWEPFDGDQEGGHNLMGFLERWEEWLRSEEQFLMCYEPKFGTLVAIPRSVIPKVTYIWVSYMRKEDVRAGLQRLGMALPS